MTQTEQERVTQADADLALTIFDTIAVTNSVFHLDRVSYLIAQFRLSAVTEEAAKANAYAEQLSVSLGAKHYPEVTQWKPLTGDLIGLLSQIDNMVTGLTRIDAHLEQLPE